MAHDELKRINARRKGMTEASAVKVSLKSKGDGLVDMKRKKRSTKSEAMPSSMREDYPYGLRIDFDNEMMSKLGMDLPDVGSQVTITAKGTVERAELRDSGDGQEKSCCIQLKKMKVS